MIPLRGPCSCLQWRPHYFSHLTTLGNGNILVRLLSGSASILNLAHDVHSIDHFSKDDMLIIQERRGDCRDEELAAVGIGTRILIARLGRTLAIQVKARRTAMLRRPGASCLRVKFSSAKDLVP